MPQFTVEDDLAELVWQLAKPKPFENLTFSAALRRILQNGNTATSVVALSNQAPAPKASAPVYAEYSVQRKAQSPNPMQWAASVPELRSLRNLSSWQAICDVLKIEVAGDSARRKLRNWVKLNRPNWPAVPSIDGDA